MSNFRANEKEAILGNFCRILPIFWTFYDKKMHIEGSHQPSVISSLFL